MSIISASGLEKNQSLASSLGRDLKSAPNFLSKINLVTRVLIKQSKELTNEQLRKLLSSESLIGLASKMFNNMYSNKDYSDILQGIALWPSEIKSNPKFTNFILNKIIQSLPTAQQLIFDPAAHQMAEIEIIKKKHLAKLKSELAEVKPGQTETEENINIFALKFIQKMQPAEKVALENEATHLIENNVRKFNRLVKEDQKLPKLLQEAFSTNTVASMLNNTPVDKIVREFRNLSTEKILECFKNPQFNNFKYQECLIIALTEKLAEVTPKQRYYTFEETEELKKKKIKLFEAILDSGLPASKIFSILESIQPSASDKVKVLETFFSKISPTKIFQFIEKLQNEKKFLPELNNNDEFKNIFSELILENPKYALQLLKNDSYKLKEIQFSDPTFIDFKTLPLDQETELAECIDILSTNPTFRINSSHFKQFDEWSKPIQNDLPKLTIALLKFLPQDFDKSQLLFCPLYWDSVECFKSIVNLLKTDPAFNRDKYLEIAAENNAPKCLSFLVSNFGIGTTEKNKIAEVASNSGYMELVYAVCNQNKEEAAKIIFQNIPKFSSSNPKEIPNFIAAPFIEKMLKILRFNSVEKSDELVAIFMKNKTDEERKIFLEAYAEAKNTFLKNAPFFSRYIHPYELNTTQMAYQSKLSKEKMVENDYTYGSYCRANVLNLVDILNSRPEPSEYSQFQSLPASSTGTRRAAALLEKISDLRSAKQNERAGYLNFSLRQKDMHTRVFGRYLWAEPLVWSVYKFSKAKDLEKKADSGGALLLKYNKQVLNYTLIKESLFSHYMDWQHGALPVHQTWQHVENVMEDILSMELSKPKDNNPETIKSYKDKLTAFYEKAAELVWLVGNVGPLARGSGTVAEWFLAIVHLHHGLQPPVLKTEFPQLDVLDITFPLSDYKKFFTYFFEQSTIPEHLRWTDLSKDSLINQMGMLYQAINSAYHRTI